MTEHASYSWNCLKCGLPNFSTTIFDDLSTSYCSSNSFSVLEGSFLSPKTSTPFKKKKKIWETKFSNHKFEFPIPRLGMSVTTQGGSGRQYVTGSRRNISKYRFVLLNVYHFQET